MLPGACCTAFLAFASLLEDATPTVTAMPLPLYVARKTWSQPLFSRTEPSASLVADAQSPVRDVAPLT